MINPIETLTFKLTGLTDSLEKRSDRSAKRVARAITGPRDPEGIKLVGVGVVCLLSTLFLPGCNPFTDGTKPDLTTVSEEAKKLAGQTKEKTSTPWKLCQTQMKMSYPIVCNFSKSKSSPRVINRRNPV